MRACLRGLCLLRSRPAPGCCGWARGRGACARCAKACLVAAAGNGCVGWGSSCTAKAGGRSCGRRQDAVPLKPLELVVAQRGMSAAHSHIRSAMLFFLILGAEAVRAEYERKLRLGGLQRFSANFAAKPAEALDTLVLLVSAFYSARPPTK